MLDFIAGILDKIRKYKPKEENIRKLFAFLKKEEQKGHKEVINIRANDSISKK
jgi:hypothetical protein